MLLEDFLQDMHKFMRYTRKHKLIKLTEKFSLKTGEKRF